MDITYPRRQRDNRLERLLAWLLTAQPPQDPVAGRIDFTLSEDLDVTPS